MLFFFCLGGNKNNFFSAVGYFNLYKCLKKNKHCLFFLNFALFENAQENVQKSFAIFKKELNYPKLPRRDDEEVSFDIFKKELLNNQKSPSDDEEARNLLIAHKIENLVQYQTENSNNLESIMNFFANSEEKNDDMIVAENTERGEEKN